MTAGKGVMSLHINAHLIFFLFFSALFPMFSPIPASADIVTDGTVGPAQGLQGPSYLIPDTLGTTVGSNLFHSFAAFSIDSTQSATFTGPDAIANVISRVTGGEASTIDGLLRSEVGQADFFFINPGGVVLGPNARVDVPAAFHVSTADELWFADGAVFSAVFPQTSTLTMARPESFGFLGARTASIEVNGSLLEFTPGSSISFSSGRIALQGADAGLSSPGGEIRLTATGTTRGSVPVTNGSAVNATGTLSMDSARVDTSGDGGGQVIVHAGSIDMNAATIAADNTGGTAARGGVDLAVNGTLSLTHGSRIQSNVFGTAGSGGIRVQAENIRIKQEGSEDFTGIFSEVETGAAGNAGMIDINASEILRIQGAGAIYSGTWGEGDAGTVTVFANDLLIDGEARSVPYRTGSYIAGISSETDAGSSGNAGSVSINVQNSMSMMNGCGIASYASGTGSADSVTVNAGNLAMDGGSSGFSAMINNAKKPDGGIEINIEDLLEMVNGAQIGSVAKAQDNASDITIHAGAMRIDGKGGTLFTGVASQTDSGSEGDAGNVTITVDGLLKLIDGATISSGTWAMGNAGNLTVKTGEMKIDGNGSTQFTGIASTAGPNSEGNAGAVTVTVEGLLYLINGASISSGTFAKGDAGSITVKAGEMKIDGQGSGSSTGIASQANSGSDGNAGTLTIIVDDFIELINGATISSSTFAKGNAGKVTVNAGEIRIDGQGSNWFTGIANQAGSNSEGDAGEIIIRVDGLLELINGAEISNSTWAIGNAGNLTVKAGEIKIDDLGVNDQIAAISSDANSGSEGDAGTVTIIVDKLLQIINGGAIISSTFGKGNAGNVTVNAGEIKIDNQESEQFTGIGSQANPDSGGNAGTVTISVDGLLQLLNGASISCSTFGKGNAGNVTVSADNISIDGQDIQDSSIEKGLSGILSHSAPGSEGDAGDITVMVDNKLYLTNAATITSSTWGQGNAGEVTVKAGEMTIENQGNSSLTGISSNAGSGSGGDAGTVAISVDGLLELMNGAEISSSTWGQGNAANVIINAGEITIDNMGISGQFTGILSTAEPDSEGDAGTVTVRVSGLLELINGGKISSSTWAKGNAGYVTVKAGEIKVDGQESSNFSGVVSTAERGSEGDAGTIEIIVDRLLELINEANISSSTYARGNAGEVIVKADEIIIRGTSAGVYSTAGSDSTGDVGTITVTADRVTISEEGKISIKAYQTLSDSSLEDMPQNLITIFTNHLQLDGQAKISAESTGNAPAGDIIIQATQTTVENGGSITTSSNGANGGHITLQGKSVFLNRGLMTTSVTGDSGSGGDITITGISGENTPADVLVLQNGFIQANTEAEGASGGDVFINANAVLSDAEYTLSVGGEERLTFDSGQKMNVIQAAAPGGEKGGINITAAPVDLSGALSALKAGFAHQAKLATNPCTAVNGSNTSSLIQAGRGGIPEGPESMSTVSMSEERFDLILKEGK